MAFRLEIQGHRGARGLRPENTLPSFEAAFDVGVTSIETDLHLTRDGIVVLVHDAEIGVTCRCLDPAVAPPGALIAALDRAQLHAYVADQPPPGGRFQQDNRPTPLARAFAQARGFDPFGIPTLSDLFDFAAAYAGDLGRQAGKSDAQRAASAAVIFDLELKRVPFHPETIGDGYDGVAAATLETRTLDAIHAAGILARSRVRSFDHRCIRYLKELEPGLQTAVLVSDTAPMLPAQVARAARADLYCPDFHFLDPQAIASLHDAGVRVLPWTVNDPRDWERLLEWQVDGITTDYPDRLASFLARE